jgi:hypothetical protein
VTQAWLVEINPPDHGFPDPRRQRQTFEHFIADEALIDATQRLHESLKHALQSADDFGEVIQQAPTVELPDIVRHSLYAKYAFAF